jgi:ribonuclease P protein component
MRVTRPADFTAVLRTGRRAGTRSLALHLLSAPDTPPLGLADGGVRVPGAGSPAPGDRAGRPARGGFVVSSAVGNSVVRHRVTRRLREQLRPLLCDLPAGTDVVVRAFPAAAGATSEELRRDLRSALHRVRSR